MRAEHGAIVYEQNVLGYIPNAMTVLLPQARKVNPEYDYAAGLGIVERYERGLPGVLRLRTKRAKWNRRVEAWTMDFKGRVLIASKKNFQLVNSSGSEGEVLMSFGKMKKHRFSLDFREPLSCIQAFSVALSSFAKKLVVA
jgi:tubby-related protein 1